MFLRIIYKHYALICILTHNFVNIIKISIAAKILPGNKPIIYKIIV